MWENRAVLHHAQLTEVITSGSGTASQALNNLASAGLTQEQGLAQVNRLIDQQAFMLGADDVFRISALLFLVLIGLVWFARPVRAKAALADAGGAH